MHLGLGQDLDKGRLVGGPKGELARAHGLGRRLGVCNKDVAQLEALVGDDFGDVDGLARKRDAVLRVKELLKRLEGLLQRGWRLCF